MREGEVLDEQKWDEGVREVLNELKWDEEEKGPV
jgi:hypothetical protein